MAKRTRNSKSGNKQKAKSRHGNVSSKSSIEKPSKKFNFSKWMVRIFTLLVIGGSSAVGLSAYKSVWEEERDLSILGKGDPVIVQIHDSSCSKCRKLKSNTESALRGLGDKIQYRIADIGTAKGRSLQFQYDVPHVTLLLFDGKGKHKSTIQGVRSKDELKESFERFISRYGKS